ncbi:MAG TPA: flagellar basal-body MS-ring/collar protein FliF [Candidatus Binatia bacterium]|nr:flagellar basal-body MS-ring/collar protein FliF [Candidatus Binatia bacterium]
MLDQLTPLLRQLTISQRIGIAFGAFASVLLLVGLVLWAGRTEYQPAFTRLAPADAAAVVEALRGAKIPYEVTDAGTTILVPAGSLADARLAAASAGVLPDEGSAFDLFDKQGFGATEFEQTVAYQRALERKLEATIERLAGVADATVAIVPQERSALAANDRPASASVTVRMRSGGAPDEAMVRGIVSTVAGAVAGLAPDNVTVVDEHGRVLAGPGAAPGAEVAAMREAVERSLAAKARSLVDEVLGPGRATVAVTAELDADTVEQTITTVKPIDATNWTPASVQTIDERYTGAGAEGAAGIPGSASNVPGLPTYPITGLPGLAPSPAPSSAPEAPASPSPEPNPAYQRTQQTVNYANSQTVERVIRQPGAIERLSVAVLIDQSALGSMTVDGLQAAIAAAVGADEARGDVVSVQAVPFAAADAPPAEADPLAEGGLLDTVLGAVGSAVGVLVALLLLLVVWRNLRALRRRAEEIQLAAALGAGVSVRLEEGPPAAIAAGGGPALPPDPSAAVAERLRHAAVDRPEAVAGLVAGWLTEESKR